MRLSSATATLRTTLDSLQRKIALANVVVGLQLFDGGCVDDLALVDNRRVARKAKAKMHVLLGDQYGGTGRAELAQKLADPLHDDRRQPFARLIEQEKRRIAHQRAGDRQHLLLAAGQPACNALSQRLQERKDLIDARDRPLVLAV